MVWESSLEFEVKTADWYNVVNLSTKMDYSLRLDSRKIVNFTDCNKT